MKRPRTSSVWMATCLPSERMDESWASIAIALLDHGALGRLAREVLPLLRDHEGGERAHAGGAQHRAPGGHALGGEALGDRLVDLHRGPAVQPELVGEVGPDHAAAVGAVAGHAHLAEDLLAFAH